MQAISINQSNFWGGPVTILSTPRDKYFLIGFVSLYTPVFLIIFQPFGVNNYDPTHQVGLVFAVSAVGFGVVNALTLAVYEFYVAPRFFSRVNGAGFILRVVLELILLASTTFLLYNVLGNFHDWLWKSYLGFIRDVTLMSTIPMVIVGLYFGYRDSKNRVKKSPEQPGETQQKLIWFEPSHGSERLAVRPQHVLYLEAQDNYVAIFYLRDQRVLKLLMRTTLKRMEQQLQDHNIKRCHRSYLVNMDQINEVRVHQQQVRLKLHSSDVWLPVSKPYWSQLKDWRPFASNS